MIHFVQIQFDQCGGHWRRTFWRFEIHLLSLLTQQLYKAIIWEVNKRKYGQNNSIAISEKLAF